VISFLEETTDGECWSGPQKPTFIQRCKMLKHWRNPCKKCIVQACCRNACVEFLAHNHYKYFWADWLMYLFNECHLAEILLGIAVFVLLATMFVKL